jgi:hypothetical protein
MSYRFIMLVNYLSLLFLTMMILLSGAIGLNPVNSLNKRLLQSLSEEYNNKNPCEASRYVCIDGVCTPKITNDKFSRFRVGRSLNYIDCIYSPNNIKCFVNIDAVDHNVERDVPNLNLTGDLQSVFMRQVNEAFKIYLDRVINGVSIKFIARKSSRSSLKIILRSDEHWLFKSLDYRSHNWGPLFSMVINFRPENWVNFLHGTDHYTTMEAQMTVIHEMLHDTMRMACSLQYSSTHAGTSTWGSESLNDGMDFNIFTYGNTPVNTPAYSQIKMLNLHVVSMILTALHFKFVDEVSEQERINPSSSKLCEGLQSTMLDRCKLLENHNFLIKLPQLSKIAYIDEPITFPFQFNKYDKVIKENCHCKYVYKDTGLSISHGSHNLILENKITYSESEDSLLVLYMTQVIWHHLSMKEFINYDYHPESKGDLDKMILFSMTNFVKLTNELCGLVAVFQQ